MKSIDQEIILTPCKKVVEKVQDFGYNSMRRDGVSSWNIQFETPSPDSLIGRIARKVDPDERKQPEHYFALFTECKPSYVEHKPNF